MPVGCIVLDGTVSPALPLEKLAEAGLYDQDTKPGERDRVLERVRKADPQPGF